MIQEIRAAEMECERFIAERVREIQEAVGDGTAINALSGGVDSSTVTMLARISHQKNSASVAEP